MKTTPFITLISDLEDVVEDFEMQPMWMIRPQIDRKYPHQRVMMTAEVVDIDMVNLAALRNIEIL